MIVTGSTNGEAPDGLWASPSVNKARTWDWENTDGSVVSRNSSGSSGIQGGEMDPSRKRRNGSAQTDKFLPLPGRVIP